MSLQKKTDIKLKSKIIKTDNKLTHLNQKLRAIIKKL